MKITSAAIAIAWVLFLLWFVAPAPLAAQPGASIPADSLPSDTTESDSSWDDTDAAWAELEKERPEDFEFEELIGHYSHGWFPRPYPLRALSYASEALWVDVFDAGSALRSGSFAATTEPFGWRNPLDGDEREILQANSSDEEDDGYPMTSYVEYGILYQHALPMPAIIRLGGSLIVSDGMLFSHDTSREYLSLSGAKRPVKEVGVIWLKQYTVGASGGLSIPFYGAFVESEVSTVGSYYYLYIGASAGYVVASQGTQYVQIASPKTDLRYGNGRDTVTLRDRVRFADLNRWRTSVDVALGWSFGFDFGTFAFEAFVSIPRSDVLNGTPWRQYFVGLRTAIGYQWMGS